MSINCEIPVIVDRIRALIADAWIVVAAHIDNESMTASTACAWYIVIDTA